MDHVTSVLASRSSFLGSRYSSPVLISLLPEWTVFASHRQGCLLDGTHLARRLASDRLSRHRRTTRSERRNRSNRLLSRTSCFRLRRRRSLVSSSSNYKSRRTNTAASLRCWEERGEEEQRLRRRRRRRLLHHSLHCYRPTTMAERQEGSALAAC
jgi:hypothetical protein